MAVARLLLRSYSSSLNLRFYSSSCKSKRGVILGAFNSGENDFKLTSVAEQFDNNVSGLIKSSLSVAELKQGRARVFYKIGNEYDVVAVVGLGKEDAGFNDQEEIDERKENVRVAASAGCNSLADVGVTDIFIEGLGDPEAAAEGSTLAVWKYQEWKNEKKRAKIPSISCLIPENKSLWEEGCIKGNAQNLARFLAEAPSNHMTPSIFCKKAKEELECLGVKVVEHDKEWAVKKCMGAFLGVTQGSDEPPKFLEMHYSGGPSSQKPIVLVGKGVTFDTGGISIKPSPKMDEMRADMGGAACVVGTLKAIAGLKVPVNVIGLTPLCENMPSGKAIKPGDIITAMNGMHIQVDNTDAEGRLILADALCYAASFDPMMTLDIATLTGAMRVAAGGVVTGVFTNSNSMFDEMKQAGVKTGDRVWRFPVYKEYSKRMTDFPGVDINNVGKPGGGGACTAAAFLKEFAPKGDWMHLDIAGVMGPGSDIPYLLKGSTGRPVRTLVEFITRKSRSTC